MMLQLHRRPSLAILCLALAAVAFTGCSKTTKPKPPPAPTISHQDADDIAQLVGATLATDNGGWYAVVQTLAESLYTTTTNAPGVPDTGSFSVVKGGNNYNYKIAYYNANEVGFATRDTATSNMDADVHMSGGHLLASVPNTIGTYGYDADWGVYAFNVRSTYDTLEIGGIVDDSTFATVNSTITAGRTKYWVQSNGVFSTILIRKSTMPGNPYPVGGDVEWVLDAYDMKSDSTSDVTTSANYTNEILAEATMSFNGTQEATFKLVDTLSDSAYEFDYRINLKTGAITRLN